MPVQDPFSEVRPAMGDCREGTWQGTSERVTAWFMDTYTSDSGPHRPRNQGRVRVGQRPISRPRPEAVLALEKRKDMLVIS